MSIDEKHIAPLTRLLLAVADDKIMLGHRNSDWTGLGPILEEDIAFSAIAQDEIAHAQALYEMTGSLDGRAADELAFGRKPEQYLCAQIVEPPDDFDWAVAIVRQFFCDHFDRLRLGRLAGSAHKPLADLARRLAAEEQVHVEHADTWMVRLGKGTGDSRSRLLAAVERLAPLAGGLFEPVEGQDQLERGGLYPGGGGLFEPWRENIRAVLEHAGLGATIDPPDFSTPGGRRGEHTAALHELLDEMCEVYRTEPGAAW